MTNIFGQSRNISGVFEDVTLVDIDGIEHRPYDYLEAGKIVIIDIFATWSGPCWNYHEAGHLQNIYETYGPDGTDEVMVFYVEGDLNTSINDISGTGNNTLGNYIACSPYPLIDDHVFPFNIGFSNFPTLLFICPNKQVQEVSQLSSTEFIALIQSECPAPQYSNNLDILYYTSDQKPFCQIEEYLPRVLVQNNGTNSISHVSLSYEVDQQIIEDSIGFDIFLNSYETVELPFPTATIYREADFDITVLTVNEAPDNYSDHNSLRATKPHYTTDSYELELQIETDNFGYEIFWFITDDAGLYVASGGNESVIPGGQQDVADLTTGDYYSNAETHHEFITLQTGGCYTFNIFDDWGDGLCCPEGNGFRILDMYGEELIQNERFLDQYFVSFEFGHTQTSTSEEEQTPTFTAYPVPTTDLINIDFNSSFEGAANFTIHNSLGIATHQFQLEVLNGENHFELNTRDLPSGNFYVSALLDDQRINIPFQVLR